MSRTLTITLLASLAALATGCGSSVSKNPAPAHSPGTGTSSPESKAGQVGDKFTITSGQAKYDVTLLSVDQQAQPETDFNSAPAGHHLTAAQFRVTAITSTDENANNNATVTGTDEQSYSFSLNTVASGTNFASGQIRLEPGSGLVGWVAFELPTGVRIARVVWTPSAGLSAHSAEWEVSSPGAASPASPGSPGGTPTTATTSPTAASSPGASAPGQTMGPADTVRAYFDAINLRDYQKAWNLGGKNTTSSYANFVSGFKTTEMVSVEIQDVSGDLGTGVVTARLTTLETDGSTKVFQGTYTVNNGVITEFKVHQVS